MPQFHNITQFSEGNSYDGKFGTLQSFFLDIEGVEGTIMTNKKPGNTPKIGNVYGDLIDTGKLGKKGQKIYQFKTAQVPDGTVTPISSTPTQAPAAQATGSERGSVVPEWFAPYAVQISQIYQAVVTPNQVEAKTEEPKPTVESPDDFIKEDDDKVPGTNMSRAELEDIFGGSLEPIEIKD